jgi:endonuclease/exonuclease/phosphatase family metal-dependent hydrolase
MRKQVILFITALFIGISIQAQDSLQIMQYNLLNYGNYWSDCTTTSNNVSTKNIHLKKIIKYVKPDIFTVNELSENTSYHQMILDQVMNTDGVNYYRKAVSYNYADSYLVNMIFYNSNKLALYKQDVVHSQVRDIDVYTLYYKAADLAQTHDTAFLCCFVAHLKAGNSPSNASARAGMVSTAMTYIRTHELPANMLFMGDFNLYTSEEQAYQNFIYSYNGTRYFYDPLNREGHWNNNSSFKDIHTQSTHAANVDCFSYGGLDDRFDFILASESMLSGSEHMKLLTNTYHVLGNDGQHFNKGIIDSPTNTSAPSDIINALYNMSDHMPVLTKILVDASLGVHENKTAITAIQFKNPTTENFHFTLRLEKAQAIKMQIYNIFGHLVTEKNLDNNAEVIHEDISLRGLSNGAYVLKFVDEKGNSVSRKFILKK